MLNPLKLAGLIVKATVLTMEPWVAEMLAVVDAVTPIVVMLNVPDVAPAGTVTVVGTTALELSEARAIEMPLGPAGPLSVTVPTEVVPPRTVESERLRPVSWAGVIDRPLWTVVPK